MGTTNLDSAPRYQGPGSASFTSVDEAEAGKGAEGQAAPQGTTPVAVEPGDTISGLMARAQPPLSWSNPEHRAQFLADNPQFTETGGRNPDLIWPGEVVYVRTGSPSQATDAAVAELAALEQQHGQTSPGSSVRAAEHRAEVFSKGEQAVKEAALAELSAGATADEILARYGGSNASPRVEAAVREAATDHAAQQLLQAQQSGSQAEIDQAQAQLNAAIRREIEADAYELAPRDGGGVDREAHGKGAIAAGNAIDARLEELGLTNQTANIERLAQTVSNDINNEI